MTIWPPPEIQHLIGFPFAAGPIDLTRATALREVDLRFNADEVAQAAAILGTITSGNIERVSIDLPFPQDISPDDFTRAVEEATHSQWATLDCALVKLRESCSEMCLKVVWYVGAKGTEVPHEPIDCSLKRLLPQIMTTGGIELDPKSDSPACRCNMWFNM